jgi:prepilin-type N-terminal cleavage/methylation domain-containing protein
MQSFIQQWQSIELGVHRQTLRRGQRGAFTLIELMLVLAVIVLIGAIAAPSLGNLFERQKLNAAIETMRLQWEEARLKAMKTGQAQVFTCELSASGYSIKPLVLQSDSMNVGEGATLATTGGLIETENYGRGTVAVAADTSTTDESLGDGITFQSCRVVSDMRSYVAAQSSQTSGIGGVNTQTVAQSVIFYPDGSTSTAEIQLRNARGDVRAIQLRGLTGQSRIIELANVPADE